MPAYTSTRYAYEGTETTETSITRVGGAADPTGQAQSRKIVTTANVQWLRPFRAEPYAIWNPTSGANVTVTVCGTVNAGALPNNDDIWLEVEYLGDAASTLGKIVTTTKSNLLAANAAVASDGSTWNNAVPTAVAFDPASVTNTNLSNGNLTATHANTTGNSGAQVFVPQTNGKWYFEVTQATTGHGLLDTIAALVPMPPNYSNIVTAVVGISVSRNGGINANNVSTGINIGVFAAGDVCGVAVDFNAGLVWTRRNAGSWNNSGTANPVTGVGGLSINLPASLAPTVGFTGASTAAGDSYTANFGATSYANAAPSGFGNWIAWTPFKLTTTLSSPQPGLAGYIHVRPRAGKPSMTVYLDPQITLTPSAGGSTNVGTANKSSRYAYEGTETTETSITRVGGAADPTSQVQSRKIVTTANSQWLRPFKGEPYAVWNPTTAANVTVTVCGTVNAGALPNNDDVWLEVEYLGDATSTLGKIVTTTKSNLLAANAAVASDGSSWNVPATAYDPTRIFNAMALSNANLTATHTAASNSGVCSSAFLSGGKYYFEVTVSFGSNGPQIGLLMSTGATSDANSTATTCMVTVGTGTTQIWANGANTGKNLGVSASGDIFGFAVDLTNHLIWARRNNGNWNGDVAANPVTGTNGITITAAAYAPTVWVSSLGSGEVVTANFGNSSYANAAPSGFANWVTGWTPFKLTATLSSPQPGLAGYIHVRPRVAKPSTTYYLDPQITLS